MFNAPWITRRASRYQRWLLAVLAAYLVMQAVLVATLPLMYEEGINLQVSRFVALGYEPYRDIFTLSNPLFVWFLEIIGRLGLPVTWLKLIFVLFGLLLLINTAVIARTLLGEGPALGAVFLLATATTFLFEAGAVAAPIPALSLATLSMAIALKSKHWPWLLAAGLVWAAGLLAATLVVASGLMIVILLLASTSSPANTSRWPGRLGRIGVWLSGVSLGLAAGLYWANHSLPLDMLAAAQAKLSETLPLDLHANFRLVGHFLSFNVWLFLFGAYGLVRLYDLPHHPLWLVVIWGIIGFAWFMFQRTPHLVDAASLLPPLAIVAGWGLARLAETIQDHHDEIFRRWPWVAGSLCLVVYLLVSWHRFDAYYLREVDTPDDLVQIQRRQEIAAFINGHTRQDECVVIDDAALALLAGRFPTPQLVNLSPERVDSGLLDSKDIATIILREQCSAIVLSKREYHQHLSEFTNWIAANFPNEDEFIDTRIYYLQ